MPIPVFYVEGDTLPEAWENAVVKAWHEGIDIRTEYDREGELPSKDCTMMINVKDPFAEPRIPRFFPTGMTELAMYVLEVTEGVHDYHINPEEKKWDYTYHKRIFEYNENFNQIDAVVKKLVDTPHTRRAQTITWMPEKDTKIDHPPCLQRLWFRAIEENGRTMLCMQSEWRSNDAFKAAFMNMYAITEIQKIVARRVSEGLGREVSTGNYVHFSNSFHIYGKDRGDFENTFLGKFMKRPKEKRAIRSDDKSVAYEFKEALRKLKEERAKLP